MDIPKEVKTYAAKDDGNESKMMSEPLHYEPQPGHLIDVYLWVRYPSYDFIFGVPAEKNPHYNAEVGFFQFRDTRAKEVQSGFYIDRPELEEMVKGFTRIMEASKKTRPDVWQ